MYTYVGPKKFLSLVDEKLIGRKITAQSDIRNWLIDTEQQKDADDQVTATFTLDLEYNLRVNDRRSEHVVCAGGVPVLSAGEITFQEDKNKEISISQISNQSTGYCPGVESWSDVNKVLSQTDIDYPEYFTTAIIFRVCKNCGNLNIVKDDYFVCIMCDSDLV